MLLKHAMWLSLSKCKKKYSFSSERVKFLLLKELNWGQHVFEWEGEWLIFTLFGVKFYSFYSFLVLFNQSLLEIIYTNRAIYQASKKRLLVKFHSFGVIYTLFRVNGVSLILFTLLHWESTLFCRPTCLFSKEGELWLKHVMWNLTFFWGLHVCLVGKVNYVWSAWCEVILSSVGLHCKKACLEIKHFSKHFLAPRS